MNKVDYSQLIKQHWQIIAAVTLSVIVLSLVLSLIQPLEYSSKVELLIIQKQTMAMDAYAAARASEKLASNLSLVIKTKSFFDKVIKSDFGIQINNFPTEEKKLRRVWQKKVSTRILPETSLLKLEVFDKDKKEANKIAGAIAYVLVNDSKEYHGGGQDVMIKVVNAPLSSDYPVKPNIILNTISGLVVGLVLSLGWVFYKTGKEIKNLVREYRETSLESYDSEEYRKDKIRSIFAPQIKTMYDHIH